MPSQVVRGQVRVALRGCERQRWPLYKRGCSASLPGVVPGLSSRTWIHWPCSRREACGRWPRVGHWHLEPAGTAQPFTASLQQERSVVQQRRRDRTTFRHHMGVIVAARFAALDVDRTCELPAFAQAPSEFNTGSLGGCHNAGVRSRHVAYDCSASSVASRSSFARFAAISSSKSSSAARATSRSLSCGRTSMKSALHQAIMVARPSSPSRAGTAQETPACSRTGSP